VDIDNIIDCTMLNHDTNIDYEENNRNTNDGNGLPAYMAGFSSSAGDIHKVMATKTKIPHKGKSVTGTSGKLTSTIQLDDNTYCLNKGELIEVDSHQYFAHSTNINYWRGKHDVAGMEYVLVDCGANGGVCGDDKFVVEGSDCFIDVSGLAQALVTTHKGDAIATFHQMALLGKGISILSCLQMEADGAIINDQSCSLPRGKQHILIDG
jgi:hypothetical protein